MTEHLTALGCTLRLSDPSPHLGPGKMLSLTMEQAGDGRYAEVYLDPASREWLARSLGRDDAASNYTPATNAHPNTMIGHINHD